MGHAPHAGHGHGHSHAHRERGAARGLSFALGLTAAYFVVELAAGLWTGSLALLSDAGHMLGDSGALILALFAQRLASRQRTRVHTFGFRRAEVLAALVNGVLLLVSCGWIVSEAIERLGEPHELLAGPMLAVAALGLVVNLASAAALGGGEPNANVRAALLHVLSDALGSLGAIAAALATLYFDYPAADTLVSLGIAVLIALSALRLLRDTSRVLMEQAPPDVDLAELEQLVRHTPGVADLHDLHAWAISEGFVAVTVHVVLDGAAHGTDVAHEVGRRIRERFGIEHVTVQPEAPPPHARLLPVERLTARGERRR